MKAVTLLSPLLLLSGALAWCPPTGPIVPPQKVVDYDALGKAISDDIKRFLSDTDSLENESQVNITATSYSISVNGPDGPLFRYHHGAELRNSSGVKEVGDDSIYRIASITKTFTVLAVLLTPEMHFDDPICKYVPELKQGGKEWEGITLEMLGSQISGIPKNAYITDLSFIVGDLLAQAGFPPPQPPQDLEDCSDKDKIKTPEDARACQKRNTLKTTVSYGLINAPGGRAAYSNTAYDLLGFALEAVHKKSYEEIIQSLILDPLKMKNTGFELPPNSEGVIPVLAGGGGFFGGLSAWETDFGVNRATGGLYSTTNDLTNYAQGIQTLLGGPKYREWLKPRSFTSSPYEHIGTPWEIYRPTNFTDTKRPVDVYTKSGSFVNFVSIIGWIPEYNVSFNILVSAPNPTSAIYAIQNTVFESVIINGEKIARDAVEKKYTGVYASDIGNMTLVTDEGPGLLLSGWYNNNTDMFDVYGSLYGLLFPDPTHAPPSASTSQSGGGGNSTEAGMKSGFDVRLYTVDDEGNRWRLTPELRIIEEQTGLTFQQCTTFFQDDIWSYNMLPIDEILFEYDGEGNVTGMKIPVLNTKLKKQSSGNTAAAGGAKEKRYDL